MYSQRSSKWADLKYANTPFTIAQQGCLLCLLAGLVAEYVEMMEPPDLNRFLLQNGGYTSEGGIYFEALEPYRLHMVGIADWSGVPADMEWLEGHIGTERIGLVEVNFDPYTAFSPHWLRVVGYHKDDLACLDPYVPAGHWSKVNLLSVYGKPTHTLERAIYRAVVYEITKSPDMMPRKLYNHSDVGSCFPPKAKSE